MDNNNTDAFASPQQNDNETPVSTQPVAQPASQPTDQPADQSADQPASQPASDAALDDELSNLSDDEVVDLFITGIMTEKGVNAPTEEIRQKIHDDLKNQLLAEIDRSLIAELPDDKLEELNRMATTDNQIDAEVVANMIEEANLDVTEITGVTMQRFRKIYLGQTTQADQTSATKVEE